jgi:phosphate transport system substrate-binding protein
MSRYKFCLVVLLIATSLAACSIHDSSSPVQSSTSGPYIENKGSDTMVNLALAWAEEYQKEFPAIRVSVSGGGTGTGIASLINKTVSIANASRAIKQEEIDSAKKNNVDPVEFKVAKDAIAVIVNPNNPINQLTLNQISDIYSGKINNWSEIGGEDRPIVRLSRETNSGTHVYFLETVLRLGDSKNKTLFSTDTLLLPSSEGITAEVKDNPNAIGYDGLGYVVPEVKVLAVGKNAQGPYVLPSAASVNNNTYPISRDLYMYTNGQPNGAIADYLKWIKSDTAQKIVLSLGFVPIKSGSTTP